MRLSDVTKNDKQLNEAIAGQGMPYGVLARATSALGRKLLPKVGAHGWASKLHGKHDQRTQSNAIYKSLNYAIGRRGGQLTVGNLFDGSMRDLTGEFQKAGLPVNPFDPEVHKKDPRIKDAVIKSLEAVDFAEADINDQNSAVLDKSDLQTISTELPKEFAKQRGNAPAQAGAQAGSSGAVPQVGQQGDVRQILQQIGQLSPSDQNFILTRLLHAPTSP